MAEHSELLAELPLVGRMTTQERLKHAHKRRAQQLKKWAQFEKDMQSKKVKHDKRRSNKGLKRIRFPDNVRLLEAASRNDVEEVRQLLESGMAPDLYNEDGLTALHQCCIDDYEEIVKLLLEAKADVNACDSELWTPLHAAATCGHLHLVQELIQHGANLMAVNADGNMPYDLCEDDVTLDYIESAMAQQDITQEKIDESRMATERWMIEDVQQLLESESDLNSQNDVGTSLLHIAAANGYADVAELLLAHKARVNLKDADGWEPLHAAACWGQVDMVELLLAHGASLNARSFLDETPIDVCGDEELRSKMLELKHKHDAIMKAHDKHKTALQRRTSSAGSRGKVVRKVSVTERNNMYRKEHKEEAIVWQQVGSKESDPELQDEEDEDAQTDSELKQHGLNATARVMKGDEGPSEASWASGELTLRNGSALLATAVEQDTKGLASREEPPSDLSREKAHHTLADLKRQRAAAKLHKQLVPEEQPVRESAESVVSQPPNQSPPEQNSIYFTAASGDPPLVKFKAPVEEAPSEKSGRCCKMM
ncbi:protein phosphatase 1 regulatory subunit 16A [Hemiscyllium ocellatum]|uniref:protein phosphatase 1 regulatory subunit 16A n=1 Tax=Hemiscyllium ocellatum TaxID=170820 RepID=UPI002966DD7E|nr:protein phosphatase 1 regulatory subunit 16A [Hemiscyllium ocellatum]XP_060681239.1 protein phosphatase 1 regulatory subunit 16A [Hemiscyllium ocellatum]XP_060681240.1 protein phosphatase 1 regulatory subunit 16A [Hemiscyllium ocellatum]XP_060681241.1 protein phosphatase 1 regulatory subunit 16A [Hemiscyllium ocellatum]XP_060681243.1 protein phosphatase 1 regulatory subunit 16A [Hemiscyllium ocellatum]